MKFKNINLQGNKLQFEQEMEILSHCILQSSDTLHASAEPIHQTKPKIVYMSTIKRMKNQYANFSKLCCVPLDGNCHFSWLYFSQFSYSPPKSIKVKSVNLIFRPNWIIEVKDNLKASFM